MTDEHREQPMPTPNGGPALWPMVIADMQGRHEVGLATYKTPLQPNNGRDMMRDAYEELLDAAVYMRGMMWERDHAPPRFDLVAHLERQRKFSLETFGPGPRSAGVSAHIRKELDEIAADPLDLGEWVDVILLALDGAWRAGHEPAAIVAALEAKQRKNEGRDWPDWRTASPDVPIEHVRDGGES
jgi:hypothetical protein